MNPQERLAEINRLGTKLKSQFEGFKATQGGEVPVGVMENPQQPMQLETVDPNVLELGVQDTVVESKNATQYIQQYLDQAQAQEEKSLGAISDLQASLSGKATDFQDAYQSEIAPARENLAKINERIARRTAKIEQFDDMTFLGEEQLRKDGAGRDMTKGSFSALANERRIERAIQRTTASAEVRADMAEAEFLRGNIETALEEINLSLETRYAPDEQALEFELKNLKRIQDRVDGAEKTKIADVIAQREQQQADINDAKALVTATAQSGYASPEEIRQIMSSDLTPEEQITASMELMARGSAEDRNRQYMLQQQSLVKRSGSVVSDSISSQVGSLMASSELGTDNDPMIDVLMATAGGRALTQSETEPLTNARRVVGQLDTIIESTVSQNTDPILGIIRSSNPYDVKARELTAQLTALVPQLARGIYGEVGVLTDSDVERYVRTLPSVRNTEQVNLAVAGLTLRNVRSAFVAQLESMAAAGRDVSGFVGIYQNMNQQINAIEAELGIGESVGPNNFADEFSSFSQSTPETTEEGGFWRSVGDFFFGKD